MGTLSIGITDHVEGPRDRTSAEVYADVARQTVLADDLGFEYAWFAEHHAHVHEGHLPAPLLFALHLAGRTRRIRLGTAILCLNLHHPLTVAEQCAVADHLMAGRSAFGFGSGSTPEEFAIMGLPVTEEVERHARFEAALRLIQSSWKGDVRQAEAAPFGMAPHRPLPLARPELAGECWVSVNSTGAARIAGMLGFNMLFSHLRTPGQYRAYAATYRRAGGTGRLAANRPVHVAQSDADALQRIEPALRLLWRRFQAEGKIAAEVPEPRRPEELCGHPINFIVGGAESVARQLAELNRACPFDVLNAEVRWPGLSADAIHDCMHRLAGEVRERLGSGNDEQWTAPDPAAEATG